MNLNDITRRVVLAKVNTEQAAAEYKDAREIAEHALAKAYTEQGIERCAVQFPGVGKVATVTVKQGAVQVDVDEAALLAVVAEHQPDEIEEVVDQAALADPEVLAWLREHRPELVGRRVRPVWRAAKVREAEENDGRILIPATGEEVTVAKVVRHAPTGAFAINFVAEGRYLVEGLGKATDEGQDGGNDRG